MGLDIDLYTPKIDIDDDGADDIIIEITGLKSINKFIGLEDTPLYYDNGKFFKVENNKIVYTDIQWKDISGNIEDAPEIVAFIEDLIEEISAKVVDDHIYLHDIAKDAHPYIQNIIHENYETLDIKIDNTKEELSQDISNLNDALNQEISDRETADNNLSEDIQEEILARIEGDTTLQNEINTVNTNLQNEIDARIEGDTNLSNSLDELSNNLIQEVLDRQEQDSILQEQITSNYNALDDKIDTEISNRTSADTTLQNNIDTEASTRQSADSTLQGNIDTLSDTVSSNYNDLSDQIDNLSDTVTSNYTTLDTKIDNIKTSLEGDINDLSTTVSNNYTTLDGKITNLTSTVSDNYTELDGRITANTNNISAINSKIPNQASSSNQLADKDFVNSSIATNTANFIGTFNSVAELEAYTGTLTNNDYAFVATTDTAGNTLYDRYKWNGYEWLFEYELNNSSFTAVQWASINSGATTENINQIAINANNIINLQTNKQDKLTAGANIQINNNIISATDTTYTAGSGISIENNVISNTQTSAVWGNIQGTLSDQTDLQTELNSKQDSLISGTNIKTINLTSILGSGDISVATSAQGALADTALQPNDNISELINDVGYITSEDLPIVNNGVLTIQVNGDDLASFSANQFGNTTANIVVPDSATWGNITGILSNQTDLQNALNNKYDASNPNGYTSNIGTVTSVNDIQPVGGNVTLSIPTATSDLTNDSGFITSADLPTVDQIFDGTSTNAQSGVAIITELAKKQDLLTSFNAGTDISIIESTIIVSGDGSIELNEAENEGLNSVTLEGKCEQRNLPSEYTQVEYLESSGTQYIDTGVKPNANQIVDIKYTYVRIGFVFGCRATESTQYSGITNEDVTGSIFNIRWGNKVIYTTSPQPQGTVTVHIENGNTRLNNKLVSTDTYGSSFYDGNIVLFNINHGGVVPNWYMNYGYNKIHSFIISENGTLVRNLIPCRHNSDNVLGMYDTVTDTFLTNAGTGNFTAGADVTAPSPETPIDIWCNNGAIKVNSQGQVYTDGTTETVTVHSENIAPLSSSTSFDFSNNILSNIRTDTRTEFQFQIQASVGGSWRTVGTFLVTSTGVKEYTFDIPPEVTDIRVKHNGATTDLVITSGFVLPEGSYTIHFDCLSYNPTIVGGIQLKDFVFCQTPYFNGGTATAEMLLGVGNYKDTQEVLTGNVTRNVGIKVLDGSEDWRAHKTLEGWFQLGEPLVYNGIAPALCTHYPYSSEQSSEGVFFSTGRDSIPTSRFIIADNVNFPNTGMIAEFKQYLADQYANGTPVIIVYPLEEPTTESVTGQPLSIQSGNNIITTTGSINNLPISANYNRQGGTLISFTNETGYITGITSDDVTTALGYTPYNATNPSGYEPNVIETIKVNDNVLTPTNKTVNIVVPTSASDIGALPNTTTIEDLTTSSQLVAINSGATTTNINQIATNTSAISTINNKIPSAASATNQLADKNFVNSSIATNTATFRGTFDSVAELEAYSGEKDDNDYAFVTGVDSDGNTYYDRYKYNGTTWVFEYRLNNSSFTSVQWNAINSGANITNIGQIATNTSNITNLTTNKQDVISDLSTIRSNASAGANAATTIAGYGNIVTHNVNEFATATQGALASTALQPNDNISSLINDVGYITNASLPTVNDATITIQKNGLNIGTFTLNQENNDTLNITVPTQASDIGAMPDTITIEDLTTTAQLNALNSGATTSNIGQITTNQNNIADIRALIPAQATTSNQLADKNFVNSSIATNTANFIGTFNSVAELEAYSGTLTNNDYAFVATTDSVGNTLYDRYKYNADSQQWIFEYELNNSSFTATQLESINSGITSGDVTLIRTALQPNDNISELINDVGYITGITSSDITTALGFTPYNSTNPAGYITSSALSPYARTSDLATVATSGSYNDLTNKPTIPAPQVNSDWNATSGVAQILNKPTLATVATSGSYNDLSNKPTIPSEVTENTVSDWGFTKNTGTVTSVNNISPVNGNITLNIPDISNLANKDLSNLTSTGNSKFQAPLVSGTNIKTINNTSLLGSGNIDIQGGSTITVDEALSTTSTNPVQNKVITNALPDTSSLSYYGTCATVASTQAKVVDCPEFTELKEGASIRVKFTYAQSYNGAPTLNVNSTGAISVKSIGTTNATRYCWLAGEVVAFTYDGTNWIMEDAGIASTTYYGYTKLYTGAGSTSTSTALTPASLNNLAQLMVEPYPVYSASATYDVGDRVRYGYQAWECITAITTAEAWDAEHWKALDPIQTQIDNINATIGDIETLLSEV